MANPFSAARPLGLPPGSIRALLALIVVLLVINQMLTGEAPGILLNETLLLILAHYFAQRRLIQLSPQTMQQLVEQDLIEREANPLWLPSHTIRTLILAAFWLTAFTLFWRGELWGSEAAATLLAILIYITSHAFKPAFKERDPAQPKSLLWRFGRACWVHLRALIILLLSLVLLIEGLLFGNINALPRELQELTMMAILFYFGSK